MKFTYEDTLDGSSTYKNLEFNESYHSSIGAYTEALYKHVLACKLDKLTEALQLRQPLEEEFSTKEINGEPSISILDVCFGLAYNSAVAIQKIREINPQQKIEIVALESDLDIIAEIQHIKADENYLNIIHEYIKPLSEEAFRLRQSGEISSRLCFTKDNVSIRVLVDDARNSVKTLNHNYFDAIFFDPFSPKSCPALWTEDFIKDVVLTAKENAYISTYSSARVAKDAFIKANCEIYEGPKLNRRNGGVLAQKRP